MFNTLDWVIVGIYCIGIISLATYVSRNRNGAERSAEDFSLLVDRFHGGRLELH